MAMDRTGEGRVGRGLTDHLYIDVDDTLLRGQTEEIMYPQFVQAVKDWYKRREEAGGRPRIVIWSVGGEVRAERAAQLCGFYWMRTVYLAKPDLIVDNGGHEWFYKKFKVVHPTGFKP